MSILLATTMVGIPCSEEGLGLVNDLALTLSAVAGDLVVDVYLVGYHYGGDTLQQGGVRVSKWPSPNPKRCFWRPCTRLSILSGCYPYHDYKHCITTALVKARMVSPVPVKYCHKVLCGRPISQRP
jgi:hypothetical protein